MSAADTAVLSPTGGVILMAGDGLISGEKLFPVVKDGSSSQKAVVSLPDPSSLSDPLDPMSLYSLSPNPLALSDPTNPLSGYGVDSAQITPDPLSARRRFSISYTRRKQRSSPLLLVHRSRRLLYSGTTSDSSLKRALARKAYKNGIQSLPRRQDAVGLAGGMVLIWNNDVWNPLFTSIGSFLLVAKLEHKRTKFQFFFVNVYGPPRRDSAKFSELIVDQGLIDLPIKGKNFTWSNNQHPPCLAKLDRVLIFLASALVLPLVNVLEAKGRLDDSHFSLDEVQAAIFQMGSFKFPCPDGLTLEFFRSYWEFINDDLLLILNEIYFQPETLKRFNRGHIALIPKCEGASQVLDFRPISLENSIVNIFFKILANRLKSCIDLISDSQCAFMADRSTLDCFMGVHETVWACKRLNDDGILLKIDFEKAFDSIGWDFIQDMLLARGFSPKWCSWISHLLSTKLALIINGKVGNFFRHKCGVRQGNPLSPFLFNLAIDCLSHLIDLAVFRGNIRGVLSH
ncbi:LINE-1 retrotransposable element ORF2 protein [Canna indica]|uniref:LINE-1 retrotransposable element ORF2 protein n=1 Tax=Canna indica TaxID=4628 RepID=A0AAQ3KCB7_9LILI|nr:LINE-1 retrotransposable element ORF2 protein [Canna indica]